MGQPEQRIQSEPEEAAVELNHLTFKYDSNLPPLFNDLNLKVTKGSRVLLIGANGAGKSTLLRILAGQHMVPEQVALVFGHSAFHDTLFSNQQVSFLGEAWSRAIPWVSGAVPYAADIPVWQMIKNIHGVEPARRDHLIKVLDIDPDWRMHNVSDGQRKRVMILLKLLRPYKVLLLDEVTTHLDVISRQDFLTFLREETEQRGATIIYATHIFDGLEDWATHLVHLSNGKVVKLGHLNDVEELRERMQRGESSPLLRVVEGWLRTERSLMPNSVNFSRYAM